MESSSPNQPIQNYEIVNPTLEQQVATLLPSVAGYGGNLRSTNTIIPIVDLTTAAEGSTLPETLNNAWDFSTGSAIVSNGTSTLITNTGFWKVGFTYRDENTTNSGTPAFLGKLFIDDGSSQKVIWQMSHVNTSSTNETIGFTSGEMYVFLNSGQELKCSTSSAFETMTVWYRQVASKDGTSTQPLNFS